MKFFRNWSFHWWEVGLMKLCLISLGIILGVCCRDYLINLLGLWWFLFAVTTVYFLIKWIKEN